MSFAVTRGLTTDRFRMDRTWLRVPAHAAGELTAKVVVTVLFSSMAIRIGRDAAVTGHVTGLLLVASEALVVALTLLRRSTMTVDRSLRARVLTIMATFGPPLVHPAHGALSAESLTIAISALGLIIVLLGKLSLGRSFGLAPANRGVVSTGVYRLVRHPIYLGYLITHVGFLVANPAGWNLIVLASSDTALLLRALCEERTLALDEAYRRYSARVRWRIIPGVF
jgi:protein-S-isoprenylcysteine O-methyltransferase Ste14